jgi:large subunit ribosomal protein L15
MNLNDLKPNPGARHRTKRVGRGESSGLGKTSGRGSKGQRSRAGGSIRPGFEGGQMPLHRRLPKRGFNNKNFHRSLAPVNLGSLNCFSDGDSVDEAVLREKGLVNGRWDGVKILGSGKLEKKVSILADAASKSAVQKIAEAGGTLNLKTREKPEEKKETGDKDAEAKAANEQAEGEEPAKS